MSRLIIGVLAQNARAFSDYKDGAMPALEEIFPDVECSVVRLNGARSVGTVNPTSIVFLPGWDMGMTPRQVDEIQHAHALWAAQSMGESDE